MALDTVEASIACAAVGEVVVVTDEPDVASAATELGAVIVADAPAAGLNAALVHGASVARARRAGCGVAALAADLPAMRPGELEQALTAAAEVQRLAVADATGVGTVLLTATAGSDLDPAYGEGSLAQHQRRGAVVAGVDVPGLRRDVDTVADLRAALRLRRGPRAPTPAPGGANNGGGGGTTPTAP